MKRQRFIQNTLIIVLGISIIIMSIGYAAYGTSFNIKGSTTIESALWDVHFENTVSTDNTTVSDYERITPASLNSKTTSLNFAVSLKPGEVYEFSTTVRNGGTYDSKLSSVSLTGSKDENDLSIDDLEYQNQYIKYSVSYDDGSEIKVGDLLDHDSSRNIIVRVEYLKNDDNLNIPEEDQTYIFDLDMVYTQV